MLKSQSTKVTKFVRNLEQFLKNEKGGGISPLPGSDRVKALHSISKLLNLAFNKKKLIFIDMQIIYSNSFKAANCDQIQLFAMRH